MTQQMLCGVLPYLAVGHLTVDAKPSQGVLRVIDKLPRGSVVGVGIPSSRALRMPTNDGPRSSRKHGAYWRSVLTALHLGGKQVCYLVPDELHCRFAEEIRAFNRAKTLEQKYEHETRANHIEYVTMPQVMHQAIHSQSIDTVICCRAHGETLAATTGRGYCRESHDISYLQESLEYLNSEIDVGKCAREEGVAVEYPPWLHNLGKELYLEADENQLGRTTYVDRDGVLFAQEMLLRRLKTVEQQRVTDLRPAYIGSWTPEVFTKGLFELHVTTDANGVIKGRFEDSQGSAQVAGQLRDGVILMNVTFDPRRCIRSTCLIERYKGAWHGEKYVGTWRIDNTRIDGNFWLRPMTGVRGG